MRTVVGVLRGGPSSEYDVSLMAGANVLEALDREKYEPRDIFISKNGEWHVHGVAMPPERAVKGVDVALNVLIGHWGEDGQVQRILERLDVPYTGSDPFSSALAFNKHHTKEAVKKIGVRTAHGVVLQQADPEELAHRMFRSFPHPAVIKPVADGSSIGISIADSFHGLQAAFEKAFALSDSVLMEEHIKGVEATVGIIEGFRGEELYALPPVEIVPPPEAGFFSYDVKYNGATLERVPGNFANSHKEELIATAKLVHKALGLRHYSRSDFIVSKRGIYFLEVNTLPGLTKESLLPKALNAVGASLSHFLDHVIQLARHGRKTI